MYEILYYWTERGDTPVKEAITLLQKKTQEKIQALLNQLMTKGPLLLRPHADKVRGSIYELRIRMGSDQLRILYAFVFRNKLLLLHLLRKKTNALPENDISLAERRLKNFKDRFHEKT